MHYVLNLSMIAPPPLQCKETPLVLFVHMDSMEVNGLKCCSITNVLQNIYIFCVLQKKYCHTGLEQHEIE